MTPYGYLGGRGERPATPRPKRRKRADDGLTTLEWLLIVAAVAGLAALAVVLVQNVVSDTSEQIAGSSARKTAAEVAASAVVDESKAVDVNDRRYNTWAKWETYFTAKCKRISITYSDAGIHVDSEFHRKHGTKGTTKPEPTELAEANEVAPEATAVSAQAFCSVR